MTVEPTRVDCTECWFTRTVRPDDGELPADVVIRHGRETGHILTFATLGRDDG